MSEERSWYQNPALIGSVLGGLGLGGLYTLTRPAVRANVSSMLKNIGRGGAKGHEKKLIEQGVPQNALDTAEEIISHLRAQGLDPSKARIGVFGVGGSGKSTMGRALSEKAGIKYLEGDDLKKSKGLFDIHLDALKREAHPGGSASVQSELMYHLDPDEFDAIVHISKPPSATKKQLFARGRDASQEEFLDSERMHRVNKLVMDHMQAPSITGKGFHVKVKPKEGFGLHESLDKALVEKGVSNPTNMSQRAKLFRLEGSPHLPGRLNMVDLKSVGAIGGATGLGAVGGGVGGHMLDDSTREELAKVAHSILSSSAS